MGEDLPLPPREDEFTESADVGREPSSLALDPDFVKENWVSMHVYKRVVVCACMFVNFVQINVYLSILVICRLRNVSE